MGMEIERKYLVDRTIFLQMPREGVRYLQGYLSTDPLRTVRVRLVGEDGYLTIKGLKVGASAHEYEYPISGKDAGELLANLCLKPLIEKVRYRVAYQDWQWEVDEFLGVNQGLMVAEIELTDPQADFPIPDWAGREVTGDPRYQNANLIHHPFQSWPEH